MLNKPFSYCSNRQQPTRSYCSLSEAPFTTWVLRFIITNFQQLMRD